MQFTPCTRTGGLVLVETMLILCYFVILGSMQAVNRVTAIQDDCPLSDIPVCGPTGVCDCSYGRIADCSGKGLAALPRNLSSDLMSLDLSSNAIECIPINFFERFTKLRKLILDNNQIRRSFHLPPSLENFDMESNQLPELNNFFIHCDNLKTVTLNGNELTNIPEHVFQRCSNLAELDLGSNYFSRLWNYSFAGLDSLYTLELISNSVLKRLPPRLLHDCTRLHKLVLKITTLFGIPEGFFDTIQEMERLHLSSMKLKTIPERLFEATSINMILDIGDNELEEIPAKLFTINPKGHFMTTLSLCGNKLKTLPRGLFDNLHYLQNLFLHNNNLKTLPGSILAGTSLTTLYLFQNDIEYLTEPLFGNDKGNSAFSKILLQDNPIREMSSAFLDELIDGGAMNLSCEQLILPTIREQLTVTCLRPSTVMVMNVSTVAARWLEARGFDCIGTQVDNLKECTSCPTGTYSRAHTCQACPRGGFYQDQVGQYSSDITSINCKNCTEGTFVWEGSGKDPLSCKVCPTGTNKNAFAGFRACFCLENYFRRDRFDACELCPQEGVQCKDDYMTIRHGYYWNWSYTDIAEYKRFVENLLTFNEFYEETATRFNGSLPKAHKCLKSGRCANDVDQITGNCAKGYTGWMCTICDEEFFPIFGHCHPCPDLKYFILETSIIFIVLALFLFLLFKSYQYQRRRSRSLVDSTLALVKIVLGFYQIMAEFWESIDVIFWPQFFKSIAAWLDILQFNISSILIKPKCFWPAFEITPYTAFTLGALFPYFSTACAILAIGAVKLYATVSEKRTPANVDDITSRLQRHQNNILTFLVLILFVTYPSTCNVIFALYGPTCDTFALDEFGVHNISILRSDYSINCNTTTHRRFQIASYCLSIYVIAFPTVLFLLLWKYASRNTTSSSELDEHDNGDSPKWLRFLYENYQSNFWYWEIIELGRKVSQTLVIVILGWNSSFSVTITLTLAVIFLSLHISFRPMEDNIEHYLQLASLWVIFFNMLLAAVPASDSSSGHLTTDILVTCLVILNTGVLVIAVVVTILKMVRIMCNKNCFRQGENEQQPEDFINEIAPLLS
ncbi:cysteine repeat modular protein A-like isoform X1 [Apostichopus japonicus]|uniref:cysteine repeat modular protein A-like isoform X1 n=2 Tax=Stichopus japonicus TaxID=307972 RepID=UPI003AB8C62F